MVFAMCEWGLSEPWTYGHTVSHAYLILPVIHKCCIWVLCSSLPIMQLVKLMTDCMLNSLQLPFLQKCRVMSLSDMLTAGGSWAMVVQSLHVSCLHSSQGADVGAIQACIACGRLCIACRMPLGMHVMAFAHMHVEASFRWLAGGMQVGHMWRTTKDVSIPTAAAWPDILENLDSTARLARFAGPGGWNDAGAPMSMWPSAAMCCHRLGLVRLSCSLMLG